MYVREMGEVKSIAATQVINPPFLFIVKFLKRIPVKCRAMFVLQSPKCILYKYPFFCILTECIFLGKINKFVEKYLF
jgi:hypothetical protein